MHSYMRSSLPREWANESIYATSYNQAQAWNSFLYCRDATVRIARGSSASNVVNRPMTLEFPVKYDGDGVSTFLFHTAPLDTGSQLSSKMTRLHYRPAELYSRLLHYSSSPALSRTHPSYQYQTSLLRSWDLVEF